MKSPSDRFNSGTGTAPHRRLKPPGHERFYFESAAGSVRGVSAGLSAAVSSDKPERAAGGEHSAAAAQLHRLPAADTMSHQDS